MVAPEDPQLVALLFLPYTPSLPPERSPNSLGCRGIPMADPGHCKLHRNPGLGDVASCKGALGRGHHGSCASNCADRPAFPLGYMSAGYMSVHCWGQGQVGLQDPARILLEWGRLVRADQGSSGSTSVLANLEQVRPRGQEDLICNVCQFSWYKHSMRANFTYQYDFMNKISLQLITSI